MTYGVCGFDDLLEFLIYFTGTIAMCSVLVPICFILDILLIPLYIIGTLIYLAIKFVERLS